MTRNQAIEYNLKTYHSRACKNCGGTERYVSSYGCVHCTLSRNDSNYIKEYSKTEKAKTRVREYMKEYAADGKISINQKKYQNSEKGKTRYKKYYSKNKDKWFDSYLKRYNLTIDQYNSLVEKQNGCCAICNVPETNLSKKMHIDHDHTTGKVRGLLCHYCNTGIGLFKEDTFVMKKAMEYLNG